MSIVCALHVECDHCRIQLLNAAIGTGDLLRQALHYARALGWRLDPEDDICPRCQLILAGQPLPDEEE